MYLLRVDELLRISIGGVANCQAGRVPHLPQRDSTPQRPQRPARPPGAARTILVYGHLQRHNAMSLLIVPGFPLKCHNAAMKRTTLRAVRAETSPPHPLHCIFTRAQGSPPRLTRGGPALTYARGGNTTNRLDKTGPLRVSLSAAKSPRDRPSLPSPPTPPFPTGGSRPVPEPIRTPALTQHHNPQTPSPNSPSNPRILRLQASVHQVPYPLPPPLDAKSRTGSSAPLPSGHHTTPSSCRSQRPAAMPAPGPDVRQWAG